MATATRKTPPPPPPPRPDRIEGEAGARPAGSLAFRAFDAAFRFLASLKLAVICLATLVATLAVATWFNSRYGMDAASEWVYRTRGFELLLAFLGMNILCAALIRYPWTKRQTGFLITHAGLLTVIGASWWSDKTFDEGKLALVEGQSSSTIIRTQKPVILVKTTDPHSSKEAGQYVLPAYVGTFTWDDGRYETVTNGKQPFKLALKKFYVASTPRTVFVPDPAGSPMIKIRPRFKPPGAKEFRDVFGEEEERWIAAGSGRLQRAVREAGPAQFVFTYTESHDVFDDFLEPPADPGKEGVARLRYEDRAGKSRFVDVRVDDAKPGQPIALPDSDLTASFVETLHQPVDPEMLGDDTLHIVKFRVRKGSGPEVEHSGFALLPTIPPIIPDRNAPSDAPPPSALLQINYYLPPTVDPKVNGRFGAIEVLGDDHGRLAYRVFSRGNPGKLGPHGLLKVGEEITAFGGTEATPMTMLFGVEEFLQAGKRDQVPVPTKLEPNEEPKGASVLAEMTAGGVTKEFWLFRSGSYNPNYRRVVFPDGIYEVAFDSDRLDLGFTVKLNDFDVGFDPGTSNPASYRSEVTLTDEAEKIKDKPYSIYMNNVLDHRDWRFFQASYEKAFDPKTERPTGEFVSVFQVAKNPARFLIYFGCIVVVIGAAVQFYMRAGIFTDGGKARHQKAEKARERLQVKAQGQGKAETEPPPVVHDADEPL